MIGFNISDGSDGIHVNQQDKIDALYKDMGTAQCKGANTPISNDDLTDRNTSNLWSNLESVLYRSAVGTLLHIVIIIRFDIQYADNKLCCYVRNPSQNVFLSLENLIRCVSQRKGAVLFFTKFDKHQLTASSDSSLGSSKS